MSDGNGQLGVSLSLSTEQFQALDTNLGGIDGAINKLAENISEPDTSVAKEIASLKEVVSFGFADIRQSVTDLNNTISDASNNLAKWLAAIALAASTPEDNSAEVQKQIDAATAQLKSSTDALDSVVKANQPK